MGRPFFIFLASLIVSQFSAQAMAAPNDNVSYEISAGDTLYDLANAYFVDQNAIETVIAINAIKDVRRIRIGKVIHIPRNLLKFERAELVVQAFSGPVSLTVRGAQRTPQIGLRLFEGDEIATGGNGFVSFGGAKASLVTIPSNSRARIVDARRFLLNDLIDIQLTVLGGRGEIKAPKLKADERFRVGTPAAITAVRGTEFRIAYEPEAGRGLTEVIEGSVVVATENAERIASEAFGISAKGDDLSEPEALLPAVDIVDPGSIQTGEAVEFAIDPIAGAKGYRTQISRDAGFVEMILETVETTPAATFGELEDGRYFVRSRAISQSGLEGAYRVYSFRRRRAGADASVEKTAFADAFKFGWHPHGEGSPVYAFQLWKAGGAGELLVDEVASTDSAIYIGDLAAGTYNWRVATIEVDEGDFIKVWGEPQELVVSE